MGGVSKGSAEIRHQMVRAPALPPGSPGSAPVRPAARLPQKGGPSAHRHIYLAGGLGNRGGEGQRGMERRPALPVLPRAARPAPRCPSCPALPVLPRAARPGCQQSEHPRSCEAYAARVTSQGPSEHWDK
jgi:hypothetical protein